MRNYIIGTAGHVDHGKTSLIKCLTGTDTDRLKEEKQRKITIDLGFAKLDLNNHKSIGIVDVPGHEKFIRNMLAGCSGMDAALLVVAANEGIMPQTREHLDILSILGVRYIVTAITKCDITSAQEIADCQNAVEDYLKDFDCIFSKTVPVSCVSGEGMDDLRAALDGMLDKVDEEDAVEGEAFYMPIDRSFTIKGFGTVVTGSVASGIITPGEYILAPNMDKVTARSIQVHSEDVETAVKGQRCAVNLKDISKDEIKRGYALATKNSVCSTMMLDVKLSLLADSPFSLPNGLHILVYIGTGEYSAKAVLIGRDCLESNDHCYSQLHFKEKITARVGDRFVIRLASPQVTIGGGVVLDSNPTGKRRLKSETVQSFRIKESGSMAERLDEAVREHYGNFLTIKSLQAQFAGLSGLKSEITEVESILEKLVEDGQIVILPGERLVDITREKKLLKYFTSILANYHREHSDMPGMPLAEAKMRLLGKGRDKDAKALLEYWSACEYIKEAGGCISLFSFELTVPTDDEFIAKHLIDIYAGAGIMPPAYNDVKPLFLGSKRFLPVLKKLYEEEILVKLDDRYIMHKESVDFAYEKLILLSGHSENGMIVLGEYRDRVKSSRKVALALLEYFDRMHITVKDGDVRYLK